VQNGRFTTKSDKFFMKVPNHCLPFFSLFFLLFFVENSYFFGKKKSLSFKNRIFRPDLACIILGKSYIKKAVHFVNVGSTKGKILRFCMLKISRKLCKIA